jgi:hypothetical protein
VVSLKDLQRGQHDLMKQGLFMNGPPSARLQ